MPSSSTKHYQICFMDYRRTLTGIALAASATLMGCGGDIQTPRDDVAEAPASQDVPLGVVYTVNYPLQYFAQRIADGAVDVEFPEIDGDPAHWEPSPDDITGFQEADLILLNGARYADWVSKVLASDIDSGQYRQSAG